jgi:hypothetical protein
MNRISIVKQSQVIASLVEGNSIRATVRKTGVAKNTVVKLLAEIGAACETYQQETLRNLPCKRVQCDEIWSFCYAKQKNVPADKQGQFGYGDVWTWTALCADTKLICCWQIGTRGAASAYALMHDLAKRLANRIQLTTDGHRVYADAVESAFGPDIDSSDRPRRKRAGAPARSGDRNSGVPPDAFNPRLVRAGFAPELLVHRNSAARG